MITSKSLYQLNIVFLFKDSVAPPENKDFMSLFEGEAAAGMNFLDDPVMRTKLLSVPKLGLSVVWEGRRLRVEDHALKDPAESGLAAEAIKIYEKLFPGPKSVLAGFGFNYDVYYQTRDVIRLQDFYHGLNPQALDMGAAVMDFGWQWTLSSGDGKQLNGYFVKITAPLELSVHHNAHFNQNVLPAAKELQNMLVKNYEATHATISGMAL